MTSALPIELPESKSYGELMKGYFTLMRSLGADLDVASREVLDDLRGPGWFVKLAEKRRQEGSRHFRGKHHDPFDPSVVLSDYAYQWDSPYRQVFSATDSSVTGAKKILQMRNRWLHFGQDPSANDMKECAIAVREFANQEKLPIAARIVPLGKRLERLISGQYQGAKPPLAPAVPAIEISPPPPTEPPVASAGATPEPRPRIGGIWTGPIPADRFTGTKFGDLVDRRGASIRDRIKGDVDAKLRAWFAPAPLDQQVWIADDGAVGGFVAGDERLLGWLDEGHDQDGARGFYTPHWYEARGAEFVDLDTGITRAHDLAADAQAETVFRVTTYGDLVAFEPDGPSLVGTVSATDWFPGHLG